MYVYEVLFSYHFCDVFYNKIFQQIYRFSERYLIITKTKHHASHWKQKEGNRDVHLLQADTAHK